VGKSESPNLSQAMELVVSRITAALCFPSYSIFVCLPPGGALVLQSVY
jgi:hypothetical protein